MYRSSINLLSLEQWPFDYRILAIAIPRKMHLSCALDNPPRKGMIVHHDVVDRLTGLTAFARVVETGGFRPPDDG